MSDPLESLKSRVLHADSMTEELRLWCAQYHIGSGPLRSEFLSSLANAPTPSIAAKALGLGRGEVTNLRQIVLRRGDVGLLEADNWYVPGRLPAHVNHVLETTDTPFGAALPSTHQTRTTLYCGIGPANPDVVRLRNVPSRAPILTVRAMVVLDSVPVAYVEEHLCANLISDMKPEQKVQSA